MTKSPLKLVTPDTVKRTVTTPRRMVSRPSYSATATSSTRCDTPSCRRAGSRISGDGHATPTPPDVRCAGRGASADLSTHPGCTHCQEGAGQAWQSEAGGGGDQSATRSCGRSCRSSPVSRSAPWPRNSTAAASRAGAASLGTRAWSGMRWYAFRSPDSKKPSHRWGHEPLPLAPCSPGLACETELFCPTSGFSPEWPIQAEDEFGQN